MEKLLYLFVIIPIFSGVVFYLINHDKLYYGLYFNQLILFVLSIKYFGWTQNNHMIYEEVGGWNPVIGIALKMNRMNALFIMLSSVLFLILLIYICKKKDNDYKFIFFF